MNIKEIIIAILDSEKIAISQLGKRIDLTNAAIWDRLKGKNKSLQVDKSVQMLKALDYKLVVMPSSSPLPKDSYEVKE